MGLHGREGERFVKGGEISTYRENNHFHPCCVIWSYGWFHPCDFLAWNSLSSMCNRFHEHYPCIMKIIHGSRGSFVSLITSMCYHLRSNQFLQVQFDPNCLIYVISLHPVFWFDCRTQCHLSWNFLKVNYVCDRLCPYNHFIHATWYD
jgi:hypothetical protein